MKINLERIKTDIEYVSQISATKGFGCTRLSYSKEDQEVRAYFMKEFEKTGAVVEVDGVGNIRAKIEGTDSDKGVVLVGSHIDTVRNGGAFDGLLGSVCALEILRVIKEERLIFPRGVEAILFAEEEGSNFGSTMLGSKWLAGKYATDDLNLLKNDVGETAYQVIEKFGLNPASDNGIPFKPEEVYAMLELHIEQGQVLENSQHQVGIVKGIFGMKNIRVTLNGVGNHAGASPMKGRKDPMIIAGKIICEVENIVKDMKSDTLVATVGKLTSTPNASNVIASQVVLYIDIRDIDLNAIELTVNKIRKFVEKEAADRNILSEIVEVASSMPAFLSKDIHELIGQIGTEKGLKYMNMFSGAVHDCAQLTEMTEVGLIFVPSIKGRSHVPEENTKFEDIEVGGNLLLETVVRLAERE